MPPPLPHARAGGRLALAHDTLIRGSAFLAESLQARAIGGRGGGDALPDAGGAKIVGNGLRELDRFLALLLDEAVRYVAPAGFDHPHYVRQTDVANKLRQFHALAGIGSGGEARLRAIGRVRACLHHNRGIVHDAAIYRDLRMAAGAAGGVVAPMRRLEITFDDLATICAFYAALATDVVAACGTSSPIP